MSARNDSLGQTNFVERFGLWTDEQAAAAPGVAKLAEQHELEVVRLSFPDQHGILRGKSIIADALDQAMRNGCTLTTTLLAKDTSHRTVYPVFTKGGGFDMEEMTGAGDFVLVPDPTRFYVLPWAPRTGWMLCDIYFTNGKPVPFSTRQILRSALGRLTEAGYEYVTGLEVEFHLFKLEDAKLRPDQAGQPAEAPDVSLLTHGYQYLTEIRLDQLEPAVHILRRHILDLGLPLRSVEVEFGPSQCEFTFHPGTGMDPADMMVLFRNAVKQICHRNGYHATFMCQPALPNLFPSGWHLHQSLRDKKTGANVFIPGLDDTLLSPVGRQFVAGLLRHARAGSIFSSPTINAYKRYKPNSLAPDRAVWGRDNRGLMLRILGGVDDTGTRIENRIGEPAANPYLYMASQLLAGMDGMERGKEPPDPSDTPYDAAAEPLPRSLMEAVAALRGDAFFRKALGDQFVDYLATIKEAEIARFLSSVTDWEQREYFEIF